MELKVLQKEVDQWINNYGVRYFDEMTNLALLVEEVGEFSRLMARKFGEQSFKKKMTQQEIKSAIEDEIGDILFVLSCLANQMDIDLERVIKTNLQKKTTRDADRHRQNKKLNH